MASQSMRLMGIANNEHALRIGAIPLFLTANENLIVASFGMGVLLHLAHEIAARH